MAKDPQMQAETDRRAFLKIASLGTVATGAAAVIGTGAAAEAAPEEPATGYRETPHVTSFYDTARF